MRPPLVDGYYGPYLAFSDFAELLGRAPAFVRRAAGVGALRGALLFLASLTRPTVVVVRLDPGWRSLLLLRAALGRRPKLVVLQFLLLPPPERGPQRIVELLWRRVERWAVPRALRTGCVLTRWEADAYAAHYGIGRGRFEFIPWPWREGGTAPPSDYNEAGRVVAAGRAFCDWTTLSGAAAESVWPLTIVCAGADLAQVSGLPWPASTTVLSDVPPEEYLALLGGAALAVFPLVDGHTSQAQIRVMHANDVGVPVVVTDVRGLDGYVVDGRTAVLVPPADPIALKETVESLLESPARRRVLRAAALERSAGWSGDDYGRALEAVIRGDAPRLPAPDEAEPRA